MRSASSGVTLLEDTRLCNSFHSYSISIVRFKVKYKIMNIHNEQQRKIITQPSFMKGYSERLQDIAPEMEVK